MKCWMKFGLNGFKMRFRPTSQISHVGENVGPVYNGVYLNENLLLH